MTLFDVMRLRFPGESVCAAVPDFFIIAVTAPARACTTTVAAGKATGNGSPCLTKTVIIKRMSRESTNGFNDIKISSFYCFVYINFFPALEWLAAMCSHIPNRGEQMVRYYGYYSNVSRGKRLKEGNDDAIPCILEPEGNVKAFRKSWARLIQKIGACPGEGREG